MAIYKAKRSNFKELLLKNNTDLDILATNTKIPKEQLTNYLDSKVMNLNNAMTISKELNCTIEELYTWKVSGEWFYHSFFIYIMNITNIKFNTYNPIKVVFY